MKALTGISIFSVMMGLSLIAGCEKPLFVKQAPRTPYERYQVLRGRERAATRQDVYGSEEPALRERLKPLNQP